MALYIKLSSTLRKYVQGYEAEKGLIFPLTSDTHLTPFDIAVELGLPPEEIKFIMLNGRCQSMHTPLHPNDRLAFFPAVGGG